MIATVGQMAGLISYIAEVYHNTPGHLALHSQAVRINHARRHVEIENHQGLDQRSTCTRTRQRIERIVETRETSQVAGVGELPAVGDRRYCGERCVGTGISNRIQ